jgi:anti-sigma B factor antagonist
MSSSSQFRSNETATPLSLVPALPVLGQTPFEAQLSWSRGAMIVHVSGEIDLASAPHLAYALDWLQEPARHLVVDLSDVRFLDASGLRVLVRCRRELAKRKIALTVVSPAACRAVRMVFEITRLAEQLHVVESLNEALDARLPGGGAQGEPRFQPSRLDGLSQ